MEQKQSAQVASLSDGVLLESTTEDSNVPLDPEFDADIGLTRSQKIAGLIFSLVLSSCLLSMSVIAGQFRSPLFARYFVVSSYSSLFLVWWIMVRWKQSCNTDAPSTTDGSRLLLNAPENQVYHSTAKQRPSHSPTDWAGLFSFVAISALFRRVWVSAVTLSWLITVCGWLWYLSLSHTDFAINDTVFQSACVFVYLISCFITKTSTLTVRKTVSVFVCVFGVALISYESEQGSSKESSSKHKTSVVGLLLDAASMLFYAVFVVVIEHAESTYFRKEAAAEDGVFLTAMMGLFCLLTFWPALLIGFASGIDGLKVPLPKHHSHEFATLLAVSVLDLVMNLSLILGVTFSNGILMSTGSLMVIPMGFILDSLILCKYQPTFLAVLGAILICGGFLFLQVSPKVVWSALCGWTGM